MLEHDNTNKTTCTPSEDSDEPGHPPKVTGKPTKSHASTEKTLT